MKGFRPEPPPAPLTEHTKHFVALVRARADSSGRHTWTRGDWLATLLSVDVPYLSGHLLNQIAADRAALRGALTAAQNRADPWLAEEVPEFLSAEAEPIAREIGHGYIGTEHILLVFTRAPGAIGDALRDAGLLWDHVRAAFDAIEWGRPPESNDG